MSTETTLKSLINPLVTGGCHNQVNASSTITLPYVVFYEIFGTPVTIIHTPGYGGITESRYQIDVFAASPEQAKGLALSTIKDAITNSTVLEGLLVNQLSGQYSELDKTYQYIVEFQIWAE